MNMQMINVRCRVVTSLLSVGLLCGASNTLAQQRAEFVGIGWSTTNAIYSMDGINWSNSPGGLHECTGSGFAAYGNGVFVTMDWTTGGKTAYSGDGINWTNGFITADDWESVAFGDGYFFATTSYNGNVALSSNGIDWTVYTNVLPCDQSTWYSLAYGDGLYTSISATSGNAAYSTDGIDWTTTPMPYTDAWQSMAFGDGTFMAIVGGSCESAYSTNGTSWSAATNLPDADWAGITFGEGKFVAVADYSTTAAYSTDGTTWTRSCTPADDDWYTVAYTAGMFVTLSQGDGYSAYSTDGVTWNLGGTVPPDIYYGIAGRKDPSVILDQPVSQTLNIGSNVTFTVTAGGFPPPVYQWYFNGASISGATNSSLTLTDPGVTNAGSYVVVVSNEFGCVTSAVTTLTGVAPVFVDQPMSQMVYDGDSPTFSVVATGSEPLTYQWQFNGTNIAGGTNASFSLFNVNGTQQGDYSIVVSNAFGSASSSNAYLTVLTPDYIVVNTSQASNTPTYLTNFTFQGDTVYYVNGPVMLYGVTTIEGGTVIKYAVTGPAQLDIMGTNLICATASYRPAIFTSLDDNSVGEAISGSTGNPWGDNAGVMALYFTNLTASLHDVRFSHLAACVSFQNGATNGGGTLTMSDFQIVDCRQGVLSIDATCSLFNGLVYAVSNLFGYYGTNENNGGQNLGAVNLTVHDCANYAIDQSSSMYFTNCLLVAVTNISTHPSLITTNSTHFLTTDAGVFQTVGAASHYLAEDSPYRDIGTAEIGPNFLADLQTKTTYPPNTNFFGWVTSNQTLSPQAQRDTDIPDLGYHYDPIDYAGYMAISNSAVTVLPGTVLGGAGPEYGVFLYSQASFNCQGTATSPNYFVRYNTVQEQSNTNWETSSWKELFLAGSNDGTPAPASFGFTEWSTLAGDSQFNTEYLGYNLVPVSFQNCQFYNGTIGGFHGSLFVTNCLFQRANTSILKTGTTNMFYNNLFWNGEVSFWHGAGDTNPWTFRDNLFDRTAITLTGTNALDIFSNNAYITNCSTLPMDSGDVILASSPAYEQGFMGDYYYPTSLTELIHKGSELASAVGLYHYTVTTNNTIEGTNIVSIGFHYVATDAYGVPLDSNGDGIPDYIEDINGNGIADPGETNWLAPPLTVWITQPANNSTIP